jgi:hypothetical protein
MSDLMVKSLNVSESSSDPFPRLGRLKLSANEFRTHETKLTHCWRIHDHFHLDRSAVHHNIHLDNPVLDHNIRHHGYSLRWRNIDHRSRRLRPDDVRLHLDDVHTRLDVVRIRLPDRSRLVRHSILDRDGHGHHPRSGLDEDEPTF